MDHGLTIMLIGFVLFFICFLVILFAGRYYNVYVLQASRVGAVIGLIIYVTGRVSVFFHNKRKKKSNFSNNLDDV
jgi:glycopeptide antibiotics resistance protein